MLCAGILIDLFCLKLFASLRKGQWHSRYLSVTRVLLQTVGWTRSNISDHLWGVIGLRSDWISSRSVRPWPMWPLARRHNSLAQCRWEHHFNWNDCHLVRELAITTSPASQNIVSRLLGILQEKVFFCHVHWCYCGVSVYYQHAPKQEETYNELAVILL